MNLLRNLSLKNKLLLAISIIFLLLITTITWQSINELNNRMDVDLEQELKSVGLLTAMNLDSDDIKALLSETGETNASFVKVQQQLDKIQTEQGIMAWSYIWDMQEGGGVNPIGYTSNLNDVYEAGEVFTDLADEHVETAQLAIQSNSTQVTNIFEDPFGTWRTVFSPINDNDGQLIALLAIDYSAEYINNIVQASIIKQIVIAVIGIIVLLALVYLIIDRLLKPLKKVVEVSNQVAKGELINVNLETSNDEVGRLSQSINTMVSNLQHLILNIRNTSDQIYSASNQLTANSTDTFKSSSSIADDMKQITKNAEASLLMTEETASAMEETATGIMQIADSASTATELSVSASSASERGNQVVQQVFSQMDLITVSVDQIGNTINSLHENTNKISEMVTLITTIAEQTNLLALNAAIEAARAGEHGKGFAVVAGEVRRLAEQSSQSATEIYHLISSIQKASSDSVAVVQKGKEEVNAGSAAVKEAGLIFQDIIHATEEVAGQIREISAASQQISASSEEVAAAVNNIKYSSEQSSNFSSNVSHATQEQLVTMQEVNELSSSLGQTAAELQSLVAKFKLEDDKHAH